MPVIFNQFTNSVCLFVQMPAKNVTDLGALMVPFDRPEQGLDMLQEAMTRLGLTPGEDLYFALNLAGHEIFDYVCVPNSSDIGYGIYVPISVLIFAHHLGVVVFFKGNSSNCRGH